MKVIFLDFDGVMNCWRCAYSLPYRPPNLYWRLRRFFNRFIRHKLAFHERGFSGYIGKVHVEVLNRIIEQTGAKIVVSSTWRVLHNEKELAIILDKAGVKGEVVGVTPRSSSRIRGLEIAEWIRNSETPVESFVILDDDSDMEELMPYLVKTRTKTGLLPQHLEQAIALLQNGLSGSRSTERL